MGQFGIGQPVRRKEDTRLLTGQGCFTDDIDIDGQIFACFVRSPQAHARVLSIDTDAAVQHEGVIAVVTIADLDADGVRDLVSDIKLQDRFGKSLFKTKRPILARGHVRFVGELVAMVIASTHEAAKDAADLVFVDYEALPVIVDTAAAVAADAPLVWPELKSNVTLFWDNRDPAEIDVLLAAATTRVTVDLVNNRLIPSPMEPRAVVAAYDVDDNKLTVYQPTQGGRRIQEALQRLLPNLRADNVRSIARDTGGGFGVRSKIYPETIAIAWAARKFGRPVKWRGDRSETFVSDYHARDQVNHAEMGLDARGRVVALKVDTILNIGAYVSENGARLPMGGGGQIIPCGYDIEKFYFSVRPVFTHTVPTDTYRGAGRPEANFILERLMDAAAEATGLSRDEIRRRNLIPPEKLPYHTQMGFVIDSGDFVGTMDMGLAAADWAGFPARRRASEAAGKLRGLGLACFIEGAGGRPTEEMRLRIEADGSAKVFAGTYSHGQGHATVYSQLVNEYLGVPFDTVELIQGDSDTMPRGAVGTFGSRSSMMGGVALQRAAARIVEKGKLVAAHLLQGEASDITFEAGVFTAGRSSVTLPEVAKAAADPRHLPEGLAPGLDESYFFDRDPEHSNFPNGCHLCEVEVDPDLGTIDMLNYVAIDDCGVVLNPLIVHGQMYGGIVQGIGQALTENVVYEKDSGQLLTGSYMDYGMPRAEHLSHIRAEFNEVRCVTNDLGVKGAGEAGCCGAPAAMVSAVVDALRGLGVRHIDMPLTPERIWRAISQSDAHRSVRTGIAV
jgi:carbon-monoxide dehydrogenase large subunit